MLGRLASLFAVAVIGAFIPVFNIEAYIAGLHLYSPEGVLLSSAVAAVGQTIGKFAWYEVGRGVRRLPWLREKLNTPKAVERRQRWQQKLDGHPVLAIGVLFASATVSLPPLLIMAVVAGDLKMHRGWFLAVVLVGRFLRFALGLSLLDLAR